MIQRIQTLFLIFILILSTVYFSGNLLTFSNQDGLIYNIKLSGTTEDAFSVINLNNFIKDLVKSIMLLIVILSLTAIFLFKRRKKQLVFVYIITILSMILTGIEAYIIYLVLLVKELSIIPGFRILIPPVLILLAILAARGIRHDEKLVKSYERLR